MTHFFRKIYLSLYLKEIERVTKGFIVRGSWRPNRTATYWPLLLWPQQCFYPILSAGSLYRILSPTDWTSCALSYIIIWCPLFFLRASHSTRPWSRLYPDIPQLDAPVIYTGAFSILTAWPGSICYINKWRKLLIYEIIIIRGGILIYVFPVFWATVEKLINKMMSRCFFFFFYILNIFKQFVYFYIYTYIYI